MTIGIFGIRAAALAGAVSSSSLSVSSMTSVEICVLFKFPAVLAQ